MFRIFILLTCLVAGNSVILSQNMELPAIFTDNMVLQQRSEVPIWGKATPFEKIKVKTSWNNTVYETMVDDAGKWKLYVNTPPAGGPYQVSISSKRSNIAFKNVLIGEVWMCSGQSNMEMPVAGWGKVDNFEQEVDQANYPQIRLFQTTQTSSSQPLDQLLKPGKGWEICSPSTIGEFSALAYFFGRDLHQHLQVPIGLIHSSWGGTPVEAWTSAEALTETTDSHAISAAPDGQGSHSAVLYNALYNAMIHPFIPYAIRGVIWNQGEANSVRPEQYKTLFPLLILDWRKQWGQDFPFYYTQLANYNAPSNEYWPELREAQLEGLKLKDTGMAVTIDIGNPNDVHPKNKQTVGLRLALWAIAHTYHENLIASGPVFESCTIERHQIRLRFKYAEQGLQAHGETPLKGFTVAGPDKKFYTATAIIEGNEILVSAPEVKYPLAVRYAWENAPVCNLYNSAGLPASPFRTDSWK